MIFPRREDITVAKMEEYIRQWNEIGIVIWYEAKEDMWLFFPAFPFHNKINKAREAASKIPAPPDDLLQSYSRVSPDKLPVNININNNINNNIKLIKTDGYDDVAKQFQNNVCFLTPRLGEQLGDDLKEFGKDWCIEAINITANAGAHNYKYFHSCLVNRKNGKGAVKKKEDIHATEDGRNKYGDWEN
jgi:hypothetical protein